MEKKDALKILFQCADQYQEKHRKPVLVTEKLAGNIRGCVGVVYDIDRKLYAPNTVLNLDMRTSVRNRQRILAMYQKHKLETEYTELVYRAKKIDWDSIRFPKGYEDLPSPATNIKQN